MLIGHLDSQTKQLMAHAEKQTDRIVQHIDAQTGQLIAHAEKQTDRIVQHIDTQTAQLMKHSEIQTNRIIQELKPIRELQFIRADLEHSRFWMKIVGGGLWAVATSLIANLIFQILTK